jgi:ABC-2 type transport system permease protein
VTADGRLATSIRVTVASTRALGCVPTAVTSLVLTPLLEVLLLVAVSASVGSPDLRTTAYAGIVLSLGLTVLGGTVDQVSLDRRIGVLQEVVAFGLGDLAYWVGKVVVPLVLGTVPAVAGVAAVLALDPAHATGPFLRTLGLLPVSALAGGLVGLTAAIASLPLSDPYALSGWARSVLVVTSGVVLPLSAYPCWLAVGAQVLPFTAVVEATRTGGPVWPWVLRELLVASAWCGVSLVIGRRVMIAVRSGRRPAMDVW